MFKVWNEHEQRWEAVSEEDAARCRARGRRVIQRPAPPAPVLVEVEVELGEDLVGDESGAGDQAGELAGVAAAEALDALAAVDASLATAASLDAVDDAEAVPDGMTRLPSGLVLPDAALPTAPLAVAVDKVLAATVDLQIAKSSNIRSASLDVATGIATVSFANGSVYRYANVTTEMMAAWQEARSVGGWFHANIKSRPDQHPVVPDAAPADGE